MSSIKLQQEILGIASFLASAANVSFQEIGTSSTCTRISLRALTKSSAEIWARETWTQMTNCNLYSRLHSRHRGTSFLRFFFFVLLNHGHKANCEFTYNSKVIKFSIIFVCISDFIHLIIYIYIYIYKSNKTEGNLLVCIWALCMINFHFLKHPILVQLNNNLNWKWML